MTGLLTVRRCDCFFPHMRGFQGNIGLYVHRNHEGLLGTGRRFQGKAPGDLRSAMSGLLTVRRCDCFFFLACEDLRKRLWVIKVGNDSVIDSETMG